MDWFDLGAINWIGVLVAFVASFALGWWWYSKAGFWKVWSEKAGLTEEVMENANMGVAFGGTAAFNLLGVVMLALLMNGLGVEDWSGGLVLGALVGLILRGGAHFIHNGFAARPPLISIIDAAHDTAGLAVAGVVLGLF